MTSKINKTPIILILLVIFIFIAWKGGLFSIFSPRQASLIQIVSNDENVFDGSPSYVYGDYYGISSGTSSGTTTGGGITNPWINAIFSSPNSVTINTGKNIFRFDAEMSGDISNLIPVQSSSYCWQKIDVYKNDQLLGTLNSWGDSPDYIGNRDYFKGKEWRIYDDDLDTTSSYISLRMSDLGDGNAVGKFFGICRIFENKYTLVLSDKAIDINIDIPQRNIVEGGNLTVNVDIVNNLNVSVLTDANIVFEIDTAIGTIRKESVLSSTILTPGSNQFSYIFSTVSQETEVFVSAEANLKYDGGNLQGLNEYRGNYVTLKCFNTRSDGSCEEYTKYINSILPVKISQGENIDIGKSISEKQTFSITPKPLYTEIGDGCLVGYVANSDGTFCIRDDVAGLSCFVLGCPIINGTNYQCTSAGICAETIFTQLQCRYDEFSIGNLTQDERLNVSELEICPSGTVCDTSEGLCIKSEIFTEIIQCDTASDCPIPCEGKTPICSEINKCSYTGECTVQSYGCKEVGCSSGYTCNQALNVCEEEESVIDSILGENSEFILAGIIVILSILLFISAFYSRKKH